jgi:hypothetical protein
MLEYVQEVLHINPTQERARRVEIYRKQWEAVEGAIANAVHRQGAMARPVRCVELDMIFPCAAAAARAFGVAVYNIRNAVRNGARCRINGQWMRFEFAEGAAARPVPTGKERAVFCRTLSRRFGTMAEAARELNLPASSLSKAIRQGREIRELFFEYSPIGEAA